jgi:hypothetical protein
MNIEPSHGNREDGVVIRADTATPPVRGDRAATAMDLLSGATIVVGLMVLIPTTLFFLIVVAAFLFLPKNDSFEFNGDALYVLSFFLLCGYGLYALWWLVPRMRRVTFGQIPKRVWVGLLGGAVVAMALVLPSTPAQGSGPVNLVSMLAILLTGQANKLGDLFGGAPLLLLVLVLVVMLLDRWHGKRRARRDD